MSNPNTEILDDVGDIAQEFRSYFVGLVASAILTACAFYAALADLDTATKFTVIGVAGLLQVAVHLRYFLHLSFTGGQAIEDLLLVLFSSLLLAIMAGGTIWILSDLSGRMHGYPPGPANAETHDQASGGISHSPLTAVRHDPAQSQR